MLSFVLAAVTCTFVCLAYSELASFLPVSGSSYTYAYASLGEVFGWWVGWSLILEYSVGASAVAGGWSAYFVGILHSCGIDLPKALTAVPAEGGLINLPAAFIVLVTTALLVIGVKESTRVNRILVYIKIGTIFVFLFLAAPHIEPANWQPSCRTAFTRRRRHGCAVLCLPWFRCLVHSGGRNEKSETGYAYRHHRRLGYLYDFVHRRMRRYDRRRAVSPS